MNTAEAIEATKRLLYAGNREERNRLTTTVDADDTTLGFQYETGGIQPGAKLSLELEDLYVWTAAGQSATVERGQFGSTAAAHTSGVVITVNPRFSDFEVFEALNAELIDLSSPANGLFRIQTVDLTYQAAVQGYDLTGVTDLQSVYKVQRQTIGPDASWPEIRPFTVARNMATGEFSSGLALIVYEGADPGRTVHVSYKSGFDALSTLTDDVETVTGIPASAIDILPIGAAIRLTAGREIKRNFTESQGDTRRSDEVPAGANLNSPRQLQALRAQRISDEASRLAQEYPTVRAWV